MTWNPHTRVVGWKTDPAKVWARGAAAPAGMGAPTLVRCWGPRGRPGSLASALFRGAPKSQPGRGAAENLQGSALHSLPDTAAPCPLPFGGRRSGLWGELTDWDTVTQGASQRQGWGPGRSPPPSSPPAGGALAGGRESVGLRPRGPPKGSAQSPKGARTQTHTREKRRGRGLTLLPGQRPERPKYTTPFPRRARARGPERGAPSRVLAARAPAREARGARGGLPGRGLGRRGSRRVHGVGERGGARAALGPRESGARCRRRGPHSLFPR